MAWSCLIVAGLFEVAWAFFMKQSNGFSRLWPSVATFACAFASFGFLSVALKQLPIGTSYAIWTGIGALGAVILGIFFFDESRDLGRIISLVFIIVGMIGIKYFQ